MKMLNLHIITDGGIARPILVNFAHVVTAQDHEIKAVGPYIIGESTSEMGTAIVFTSGKLIVVTERLDAIVGELEEIARAKFARR